MTKNAWMIKSHKIAFLFRNQDMEGVNVTTVKEKLPSNWQPTGLVQKAFNLAAERHSKQTRKGEKIPYLSHLMAVSALVTENGQFQARGVSQYRQIIIIAAVSRAQYLYIASIS